MTTSRRAWSVLAVLLAGCAAHAIEPVPPVPPPVPTPAPLASAPEPPPASPPPPVAKADFHVIATITGEKNLAELRLLDTTVLLQTADRLFPIVDGALVRDDSFSKGLELGFSRSLVALGGHYPDPAFAAVTQASGRTGMGAVVRREKGVWTQTALLPINMMFHDVQTWDRGRTVALASNMFDGTNELLIIDGSKAGPVPRLAPRKSPACKDSPSKTELLAESLVAFRTGELYLAGDRCDLSGPVLEVFPAGASRGTLIPVPRGPRCEPLGDVAIAGVKADQAYVTITCGQGSAAEQHLFSFDGTSFHELTFPAPGGHLQVAPDGTLFLVSRTITRRNADGTWTPLTFPGELTSFVALSATDAFLTTENALLRTGEDKGAAPPEFTPPEYGAELAKTSLRVPQAATPGCESPFVLLFGFTRTTPEGYDFPLTRAALRGHSELSGTRFVVTKDRGKRYFGAVPPSFAIGKQLVALVKDKVKDSSPQLLCVKPEEERELKLDLATGEVAK